MIKLKKLLEIKIPDVVKELGYNKIYYVTVERWPIYGHNLRTSTLPTSKKTIAVSSNDKTLCYILELKKYGRVFWEGKNPIRIVTKNAKYIVSDWEKE